MNALFHISLPCLDIKKTENFYINVIGAKLGRKSENWLDINLYGNQITFSKAGKFNFNNPNYIFEGKILPSFHFGVIIDLATWASIYKELIAKELNIVTKSTFLKNKPGEHLSFFVKDPNGYMLEFKNFKDNNEVFTTY